MYASFAIDLDALDDYNDIRADETNGVWKRKGAAIAIVSIHKSKNPAQVTRRRKMRSLPHYYKLSRTYYTHSCSPDFHRIITTAYGKLNHSILMCMSVWFCVL